MRDPAEITKASAIHIAKWRIEDMLENDKSIPTMQKIGLRMALNNGAIEQIADMLYNLGLKISVDKNNERHLEWIKTKAVRLWDENSGQD